MNGSIEWPDPDSRGVVSVRLTRANVESLLAGVDSPVRCGTPGLLTVDGELVVCVTVEES